MILPDHQIRDMDLVRRLNPAHLQPASVDLTLGVQVARITFNHPARDLLVVGRDTPSYTYSTHSEQKQVILRPDQLILCQTAETLHLPNNVAGRFEGKSSLGRIGLMTHIAAGFIDPGFHGVLTLEVYNCGPLTLVLTPGIRIGQVAFYLLNALPTRTYGSEGLGSHYQNADTVQGARF